MLKQASSQQKTSSSVSLRNKCGYCGRNLGSSRSDFLFHMEVEHGWYPNMSDEEINEKLFLLGMTLIEKTHTDL